MHGRQLVVNTVCVFSGPGDSFAEPGVDHRSGWHDLLLHPGDPVPRTARARHLLEGGRLPEALAVAPLQGLYTGWSLAHLSSRRPQG